MRSFNYLASFVCLALCLSLGSRMVNAQITIQLQPVLSGLSSPLYVTNAKDGSNRLFVVEQGGVIRVAQPGATTTTQLIDISSKIVAGGEQGLLGLAFHPQFALNRKFYVNYTRASDAATVIAEYTVTAGNPIVADIATERILLVIPQPFSNHNGGMIEFGPDGFLYIGMGDGGSANDPGNRAQNRALLLGKMLRIGVDVPAGSTDQYTIPADNPFVGANTARCPNGSTTSGNTCQEIWSIGMRNPFRWSFDRAGTRQLIAADVGQGQLEEIDVITRGANYGWRVYEGTNCTGLDSSLCTPANYTAPVYEYFNAGSNRCSITGGYVYRGRRGALPVGTYVFSDYCTGEIMIQGAPRTPTVLLDTPRNVSSFGEDEAGELYVVGLGGTVERIVSPTPITPRNTVADFDGDLRTDLSVFRSSSNVWYSQNSSTGIQSNSVRTAQFGLANDTLAPGDFDGDGRTDFATFRNGVWYTLSTADNTFRTAQFGLANDIPVAGDYDGDKKTDFAVFRPSNNVWYVLQSLNSQFRAAQWGAANDKLVPADYDGDGKTDIAVWRPTTGDWFVLRSDNNSLLGANWGANGDVPVAGDYDADGKSDLAVWRPGDGTWFVLQSGGGVVTRQWGIASDVPVPGDYDADGKIDFAVTRNQNGLKYWYITRSFNPGVNYILQFGLDSDVAVPTVDVP